MMIPLYRINRYVRQILESRGDDDGMIRQEEADIIDQVEREFGNG